MKNNQLIYAFFLFSAFASCKKDNNQETISTKPLVPVIAAVSDSVSYTIDGKTYTAGGMDINYLTSGGEDANRKLVYPDSTNKHVYSLIGPPDSVMYFQKSTIFSNNANIRVFFLKKFIKQKQGLYWMPGLNDELKLFTVGKHPLAEDFEWKNSQNGIAIDVSANDKAYSSYNAYNGINTVMIPPGFQKNSSFEIISFTQTRSGHGGYNLEARFNAVVFDAAGQQKKLDNGYLRLYLSPEYNIYAN